MMKIPRCILISICIHRLASWTRLMNNSGYLQSYLQHIHASTSVGLYILTSSHLKLIPYIPDPAVYPYFDIYSSGCVSEVEIASTTVAVVKSKRVRKTHAELRRVVLAEFSKRSRKTHEQLRNEVLAQVSIHSETLGGRRLVVNTMSAERKPSYQGSTAALQTKSAVQAEPSASFESSFTPPRPSEIRRAASLNRSPRPLPDVPESVSTPLRRFPSMQERHSPSSLHAHSRSNSNRSPLATMDASQGSTLNEDASPARWKHQRDSIVLEKVRHWGAAGTHFKVANSGFLLILLSRI